jgi:hypothetical protein
MAEHKFTVSKEILETKTGVKIQKTIITAKKLNNLITYSDIEKLYKKMKNSNIDTTGMKIVGSNKYKLWTMKSEGEEDFTPEEDYFKNKSEAEKLNAYYQVVLIAKNK